MQNWVKRGHVGSRDPLLEFWAPTLISRERLKLETSNLARKRTSVTSKEKNAKLGQRGSCGGHVTQFWNFGTPLISRERLKLETSNLAQRRTSVTSNEKKCKIGSKGVTLVPRYPISEFWDPLISRERLELETSNLAWRPPEGGEF